MCVLQGRGRLRRWIPATKSNEDLQFTNEGKLLFWHVWIVYCLIFHDAKKFKI